MIEEGIEERRLRCLYVGEPSITEYTFVDGKVLVAAENWGPARFDGGSCAIGLYAPTDAISGIAVYNPVSSLAM
jgi:hypothetical protein